jgi:L-lactate dehydrogenase complex protein LldG
MEESTSREKILKKIRKALVNRGNSFYLNADFDSPLFKEETDPPEILFAKKFTELKGNFVFCVDEREAMLQLRDLFLERGWKQAVCKEEEIFYFLEGAGVSSVSATEENSFNVAVSLCECISARTGSFFVSAKQSTGRRFAVDNDVHIVIAYTSQVVDDISDGFEYIKNKYEGKYPSMISLISGPSKTADIQQQLVYGAHGPGEIFCFLIEG